MNVPGSRGRFTLIDCACITAGLAVAMWYEGKLIDDFSPVARYVNWIVSVGLHGGSVSLILAAACLRLHRPRRPLRPGEWLGMAPAVLNYTLMALVRALPNLNFDQRILIVIVWIVVQALLSLVAGALLFARRNRAVTRLEDPPPWTDRAGLILCAVATPTYLIQIGVIRWSSW
jgi:hypothetical protein